MNFGVPKSIQADNGKEFRNSLLNDYHRNLNVTVVHGRPRNPRAQGQVERVNQTIKRRLSKALNGVSEKRWVDLLPTIVRQYNTTIHRATNKSPFMLFHGQSGFNLPVRELEITETDDEMSGDDYEAWVFEDEPLTSEQNVQEEVRSHFTRYRANMIANSNPNTVERRLNIGDRVLLKIDFDNNTNRRRNAFDAFFEVF
jgi:transposase InsO family protein